jgi:hypothetical protein
VHERGAAATTALMCAWHKVIAHAHGGCIQGMNMRSGCTYEMHMHRRLYSWHEHMHTSLTCRLMS